MSLVIEPLAQAGKVALIHLNTTLANFVDHQGMDDFVRNKLLCAGVELEDLGHDVVSGYLRSEQSAHLVVLVQVWSVVEAVGTVLVQCDAGGFFSHFLQMSDTVTSLVIGNMLFPSFYENAVDEPGGRGKALASAVGLWDGSGEMNLHPKTDMAF